MIMDASEECYAFASFRLYPQQRTLIRDSDLVTIGGRAFDVLLMLVSHSGVVVSLKELMDTVWPSVTVEEANLRVQMGVVRKILSQCEDARRAIETIPLRGYCFILPVRHQMAEAAAADAKPQHSTSLPTLPNPVVGRDEDIGLIGQTLRDRRLVTVTGPGGIGKTTVAIATANRWSADAGTAVGFVDLSQAPTGEDAASAIALALGIAYEGDATTLLCEGLRSCEMLLILDTCEHIVEPIAMLVETLLSECAALKILVTSREALRAAGEWSHRLGSLSFPEEGCELTEDNLHEYAAVTLFLDRVHAATYFTLQARDLPLVGEICRRLDGIPLALEFAAARVSDLGIREIASHLDDCFSILTRGRRTALPRHRTLSAALEWSYGLLTDSEQKALANLARLPGSFTTDDAIALCEQAGCERPPNALSSLFEKSLLSVDFKSDAPVYRLLDTTKTYVMTALAA